MKSNDQLEPTVFVIFGGAGDLTWRKLVPALFDLSQDRSLPAQFAIIAVGSHRVWFCPSSPTKASFSAFKPNIPGPKMQLRPVDMRFSYRESFDEPSPDAYETLLLDVMKKDATLFMRADQVEAAWELLMPVLEAWQATAPGDFPNYAAGTWGSEDAQRLLAPGHLWPLPTELMSPCKKKKKIRDST